MTSTDHPAASESTLPRLAERWADYGPPIIVFNKSHSGSRLLARLLLAHGVFLGTERNESEDALGIMDLVRPLVEGHYPDYASVMSDGDAQLEALTDMVFGRHLCGIPAGARWGWKLCETLYILPVLTRIFPDAFFVHLIRDGRDVAFSNHVAPKQPFWRKIYFDTDRIASWDGRKLGYRAYHRVPHIYNARHWVNSVTVGRNYGSMIGEKYLELRYEDLVLRPMQTAATFLMRLGIVPDAERIATFASGIDPKPVGKHRRMARRPRSESEAVLRPTLEAFGYGIDEKPPFWPHCFRR